MFSIIDVNTGDNMGYYHKLDDAVRDYNMAINDNADLVIIDTEQELVVRWSF